MTQHTPDDSRVVSRRQAIKWMLAASATVSVLNYRALGAPLTPDITAKGYGTDPKLLETYEPGDLWPLTLTPEQRRTTSVLCDIIIPADAKSPAASSVGVVDFIDDWISAPYPAQQYHREIVLAGLDWLGKESQRRFQKNFPDLSADQQHAICDDICFEPQAAPEFKHAAQFFAVMRNLTASGFYTTPVGWKDIGYVGNMALNKFDGPPPEVLKYLGLS